MKGSLGILTINQLKFTSGYILMSNVINTRTISGFLKIQGWNDNSCKTQGLFGDFSFLNTVELVICDSYRFPYRSLKIQISKSELFPRH